MFCSRNCKKSSVHQHFRSFKPVHGIGPYCTGSNPSRKIKTLVSENSSQIHKCCSGICSILLRISMSGSRSNFRDVWSWILMSFTVILRCTFGVLLTIITLVLSMLIFKPSRPASVVILMLRICSAFWPAAIMTVISIALIIMPSSVSLKAL